MGAEKKGHSGTGCQSQETLDAIIQKAGCYETETSGWSQDHECRGRERERQGVWSSIREQMPCGLKENHRVRMGMLNTFLTSVSMCNVSVHTFVKVISFSVRTKAFVGLSS